MAVYTEATLHHNAALLNAHNIVPFITSMLSLTLITNLLTTCGFPRRSLFDRRLTKSLPCDDRSIDGLPDLQDQAKTET